MVEARIGHPAPPLAIGEWLQGRPTPLADLAGRVVLVAVFQVNCPGCFLYCLPRAEDLHWRYQDHGLTVLGLATAFEDFDKNTLGNLRLLLESGRVIGETEKLLKQHALLQGERLPYSLSFPVAMDRLTPQTAENLEAEIDAFVARQLPDFETRPPAERQAIRARLRAYFAQRPFRPETFERYRLQGTPSYLLIDRAGILRASRFGAYDELEADLTDLL